MQFVDDASLANDRGLEAIKITLLERSNASVVRVIELFFQDAPPLPPEPQGVCDQRRRHRPFDVVTSGLGTCAADSFVLSHALSLLASILGGAARINKILIREGLTVTVP